MQTTRRQSLTDKYRPTQLSEIVLPTDNCLSGALAFAEAPYPSGWLFHGKSGLGKTSMAQILALLAAQHPLSVHQYVGPDLDSHAVKDLANTCGQPPLFGRMHAVVVDESDGIPSGGQIRLLSLLDNLHYAAFIFTSNESLENFESRFISRLKCQLFTSHGLCTPATKWIMEIALKEGISLTKQTAERIVKEEKNNLRAVLQRLELLTTSNPEIDPKTSLNCTDNRSPARVPALPFILEKDRVSVPNPQGSQSSVRQ